MTSNKRTRIAAAIKTEGWHRYPTTFAVMLQLAETLPQTMTARETAAAVIRMYQQHAAGKMEGGANAA